MTESQKEFPNDDSSRHESDENDIPPTPSSIPSNEQAGGELRALSDLTRSLLDSSLWGTFLLLGMPLLLSAWLTLACLSTVYGALLLLQTEGFEPTTYGGAFWFALVLNILGVGGGALLMIRWGEQNVGKWRPRLARPSVSLFLGVVIPAGVLSIIELLGTDISDTLTTAFILGSIVYTWFLLPFIIFSGLIWARKRVRRFAIRSEFAAGLATGLFPLSGIASAVAALLIGSIAWSATLLPFIDYQSNNDASLAGVIAEKWNQADNLIDGSLAAMAMLGRATKEVYESEDDDAAGDDAADTGAAAAIDAVPSDTTNDTANTVPKPSSPSLVTTTRRTPDPVTLCVDELQSQEGFLGAPLERGKRRVARELPWFNSGGVEDLAWDVLVDVCQRHRKKSIQHLPKYYNASLSHRIADQKRRKQIWTQFVESIKNDPQDPDRMETVFLLQVLRCLEHIPTKYAEIIYANMDSENTIKLAQTLGIKHASARKRLERARKFMKKNCEIDRR